MLSLFKHRLSERKSDTATANAFKRGNSNKVLGILTLALMATGCERTPPDYRDQVTAPVYTEGDSQRGEQLYEELCSQCHTLRPGSNKKGPQLLGVYNAPAAELEDYNYSQELRDKDWVWDAETLDPYIADPVEIMPDTRMLSDPITDVQVRKDIIAYLSTLGRDPVVKDENQQ